MSLNLASPKANFGGGNSMMNSKSACLAFLGMALLLASCSNGGNPYEGPKGISVDEGEWRSAVDRTSGNCTVRLEESLDCSLLAAGESEEHAASRRLTLKKDGSGEMDIEAVTVIDGDESVYEAWVRENGVTAAIDGEPVDIETVEPFTGLSLFSDYGERYGEARFVNGHYEIEFGVSSLDELLLWELASSLELVDGSSDSIESESLYGLDSLSFDEGKNLVYVESRLEGSIGFGYSEGTETSSLSLDECSMRIAIEDYGTTALSDAR